MKNHKVKCSNFEIANDKPFTLIAGPCQLENEEHALKISTELKKITSELGINLIYKTSFDKANRTSLKGKRGLGLEKSLPIFDKIRREVGVPILTDVHTSEQCSIVAKHVDILQIPAFLCRQTDLLIAAAKTKKIINVKKGQFLAPWDMVNVTKKISDSGNNNILVTERGASFGYNALVSDMRSLPIFDKIRREVGVPILTDVHTSEQCSIVAKHVDILQIPAFLCRQTDLLIAAAKTGKIINVKKGQFLAPWDMANVIKKIEESGNKNILITERGASFGLSLIHI